MAYTALSKLYKFTKQEFIPYFESGMLRFSSNVYFAKAYFQQVSEGNARLNHKFNDPVEALDINYIERQSYGNMFFYKSCVVHEKPTFFMFSMFSGTLDQGKKLFCSGADIGGFEYDACIEFSSPLKIVDLIHKSNRFYLPDSKDRHKLSGIFDEPIIGEVTYETPVERIWNYGPLKHNPFRKNNSHLEQCEHRIVLSLKTSFSPDAINVKADGINNLIEKIHRF